MQALETAKMCSKQQEIFESESEPTEWDENSVFLEFSLCDAGCEVKYEKGRSQEAHSSQQKISRSESEPTEYEAGNMSPDVPLGTTGCEVKYEVLSPQAHSSQRGRCSCEDLVEHRSGNMLSPGSRRTKSSEIIKGKIMKQEVSNRDSSIFDWLPFSESVSKSVSSYDNNNQNGKRKRENPNASASDDYSLKTLMNAKFPPKMKIGDLAVQMTKALGERNKTFMIR